MAKLRSQESIFVIRKYHVEEWQKKLKELKNDGHPRIDMELVDKCYSCRQSLQIGQLCHSKLVGKNSQRRHAVCAIKHGVLRMTLTDYKIFAAGLKIEKEFFKRALEYEAKKVAQELQEQIAAEYPYFRVVVSISP